MMVLNAILRANSLLIPPLGFLLNFTLLWLILRRTPKEMWLHSRVLLQTCILDIFLLIVFFIAMPYATFLDGGHGFFVFDGYLLAFGLFRPIFEDPINLWLLFLIWHFFFQFDVFAIAVQFLYRYLVLNRGIKVTLRRYLLFLIVPLMLSTSATFLTYFVMLKPLQLNAAEFSTLISLDLNQNLIFARFELNLFLNQIVMLLISLCYIIFYIVIIYCGRKMVKYVAAHTMNDRLKELNKQLTKSLIICASYPLIFQAFIAMFFLFSQFIMLVNEGLFINLIISWLPILNPLASLWTFRPYREALMAPFKKLRIMAMDAQSAGGIN